MGWLKSGAREVLGLFVDDGAFAALILAWLAFSWAVMPRLDVAMPWKGLLLAAGLLAILVESAARRARD